MCGTYFSCRRIRNQNLRNEMRRNQAINDTNITSDRRSVPDNNFVVTFRVRGYEPTHCHGHFPFEDDDGYGSTISSLSCDDDSCYDYDLDF